jgi:hypothetical protein
MTMLVSWIFPVVVVAYLLLLTRFVATMRNRHAEYWASIGNPDLWAPSSQGLVLKKVFFPSELPPEISQRYKLWLNLIRGLAFLGIALFIAILLMIWLGMFK